MELIGWKFDINFHNNWRKLECVGDTWYGFLYPGGGSINITLNGSGHVSLNFGNCGIIPNGVVKLFLNDDLKKLVTSRSPNNNVNIPFSDGNVLKIEECHAIIKLNFMEIKCSGNDYGIIK
jgi:hypothetical protein